MLHFCQKLGGFNWLLATFPVHRVHRCKRDDRVFSERSFRLRAFWSHSLVSFGDFFTFITCKVSWGALTTSCRVLALAGELVRCSGQVVGSEKLDGESGLVG